MIKRLMSALLAASLAAVAFAGCATELEQSSAPVESSSQAEQSSKAEDASSEHPTDAVESVEGKLVIWEHANTFEEPLLKIIDNFKEVQPAVIVEHEIKSGDNYYNLLTTSVQAGEAPDLFWTNGTATSEMTNFINQDVIYDLSDIVDTSDLEPESLEIATVDGKLYSVPWMTFDTRACYYNKDIFTELGLEVPKTFDEFETLLATLKDNGKIPISLGGQNSWSILFFFEPLMAAMEPEYTMEIDGYKAKSGDPRVGNVLNKALEWAELGYYGEGYLGVDGDGQSLSFTKGNAAMIVSGSWDIPSFAQNNPDLNFGAFQIPSKDGTTGMVGTYSNGFSVYKKTQSPEAAFAFVNYCASLEAQTIWVQTLEAVSGSPKIESSSPVAAEIADCQNRYKSWQANLSKYNIEGQDASSIWNEDSTKVFSKAITVEQFLENINNAMQ